MLEFSHLGLREELVKASAKLGFVEPTPIQAQAIPVLLESNGDLVALAGTGTGKTAAFGMPLLHKLDPASRQTQCLVLSPTRELCCQIAADLQSYAAFMPRVSIVPIYGGASMGNQIRDLRKQPQIIVATPGRLIDHMERGNVDLSGIHTLVLDEADEMLSMGFRDELETILAGAAAEKQTCLFSATMPRDIRSMVKTYLNNPQEISVVQSGEHKSKVDHHYFMVNQRDRFEALRRFIAKHHEFFGIVFCRTKDQTREIATRLAEDGLSADALHGDLSQMQRDYVMQRFRSRIIRILVATDVAARGIDVDDLTHVVHFELPHDAESYVHRSGRTGRAGKSGISLAIITPKEGYKIHSLGKRINNDVKKIEVPTGSDILQYRIAKYVDTLKSVETISSQELPYLADAIEQLRDLPKDDLVERILYSQFGEQIQYYHSQRDIQSSFSREDGRQARPGRREGGSRNNDSRGNSRGGNNNVQYDKILLPMGSESGLKKGDLIGLANKVMRGKRFPVGEVRLKRNSATMEVPKDISAELAKKMDGKVIREKKKSA